MKTWQKLKENPSLWEKYFIREKVLTAIRRFFFDRGFHEVETPYLVPSLPPESYVDIFETTLFSRDGKKTKAYLPTSPEPFLKKLLAAGIGNCFSLPKSFRNGEDNTIQHNPEFTILEWYRINADYLNIMDDFEELLKFINTYLIRSSKTNQETDANKITYQGKVYDISSPWERISVAEAFSKYANLDMFEILSLEKIQKVCRERGYNVSEKDDWEALFDQIILNDIEPNLGKTKPTIFYDYPVALASLSKKKSTDPRLSERFEVYMGGLELGNAFSELCDWKEQKERFEMEKIERAKKGRVDHPIDYDFIEALKMGMPPSGGIAVGVDRLIMLFSDSARIADTLLFPAQDEFWTGK